MVIIQQRILNFNQNTNIFGELNILLKYFDLINVKKYNKTGWQTGTLCWPFITLTLKIDYKLL